MNSDQADTILWEHIATRAYFIWEREGRPAGRDALHWHQAKTELLSELSTTESGRKFGAAKPTAIVKAKLIPLSARAASGTGRSARVAA